MGNHGLRPAAAGLAVIMLCALLAACGSSSAGGGSSGGGSTGSSTLTIADFSPFSGPNATYGFLEQAGCAAAVKLINQQGGVMGHQLNCTIVDSRGDPADAVPAAQQMLATASNLIAIVDADSGVLTSTVPLFNQAKVPDMSVGGDVPFDKNKYPYFWRTIPGDDVNGYALAAYIKDRTPYTKVASMFANDQAAQGNVPGLASGARTLGLSVPITESLAVDQQTYETEIQRMKSAGTQVLASETDPQTAGVLFGEMKQAGSLIPGVLTSGTTGTDYDKAITAAIGAKAFESNFVRVIQFAPSSGTAYQTWVEALKSIGNSVRGAQANIDQIYSEIPYDNTVQIALAILAAHSINRIKINEFIPKVVAGSTIVHTFQAGKAALAAGKTIDFVGVEGQVSFDKYHNSQGQWGAFRPLTNKLVAVLSAKQVAQAKGQ